MRPEERDRLLGQVRKWFGDQDQVAHYAGEVVQGATVAEQTLLGRLPAAPAFVLDLGCGAGRIARITSSAGYPVVAVDLTVVMLTAARAACNYGVLVAATDPLVLPFRDASFDAALAFKLYCYVPSSTARIGYLAEVARVLRPGAPLLLTSYTVPSRGEAEALLKEDEAHTLASQGFSSLEPLDTFIEGRGYVHWFTADELIAELGQTPFVVEHVDPDPTGFQLMVSLRRA